MSVVVRTVAPAASPFAVGKLTPRLWSADLDFSQPGPRSGPAFDLARRLGRGRSKAGRRPKGARFALMRYTLTADHRIIDGAFAAQFLATLTDLIEHPLRIVA
ncbi:hypothetical protein GCM10022251_77750 [Phytohabitans flavus]|uniref:2-oxoacid dehydrogenase acyltransferase catalytic domain-containing protein n=1 Tax=Phytohabitans flavus TaxID=1076124 RepID=A0A6F8XNK6_9ACTN|nr:hypothetical protein Pflav_018240 [Phytohabitans flavus]